MLNAAGGLILFVISDRTKLTGQDITAHTIEGITPVLFKLPPAYDS
jgi:hypothetical protein